MPSDRPGTLGEALVALQACLPRIVRGDEAQIGSRTYKYANLATVTEALMPLMAGLGLFFTTRPDFTGEHFVLRYTLAHVSGEELGGAYPLPASGGPQQIGSAITYARRYALLALTGAAPSGDDDDGAAAERAPRSAGLGDEERDAAGLMTSGQRAEHDKLRRQPARHGGPVERIAGAAPDDQWNTPPEEQPGSSTPAQRRDIAVLYGRLHITERDSRLVDLSDRTGREIGSSKELSYSEAQRCIGELGTLALSSEGS